MSKRKEKIKIFRSLRLRLFLLIMIVGMIPGILIHFGIMEQYMNNAISVKKNARFNIVTVHNGAKILPIIGTVVPTVIKLLTVVYILGIKV